MKTIEKTLLLLLLVALNATFSLAHSHSHGGEDEELTDADRRVLRDGKIGLIISIFAVTLLTSFLPWIIGKKFKNAVTILTIGMTFAGGIILGSVFVHLLPTGVASFEEYFEESESTYKDKGFPFAGLICGATLVILIAVDQLAVQHGMKGVGDSHNHMVIDLPPDEDGIDLPEKSKADLEKGETTPTPGANHSHAHHHHSHGHSHDHSHSHSHSNSKSDLMKSESVSEINVKDAIEQREKVVQAWVFFVALSLHSIFDGLSIGAEHSISGFYALLIAVLAHKLLDGFALGVPVYFAKLPLSHTLFALIFSASMTPLGLGIGWAATASLEGPRAILSRAIIISVSAGSFVFIALVELIPSGLHKYGWMKVKLVSVAIGFGIMALIGLWV